LPAITDRKWSSCLACRQVHIAQCKTATSPSERIIKENVESSGLMVVKGVARQIAFMVV